MGNICRSPTAHGVFEALVAHEGLNEHITVDSAGTHAYHVGSPPDPRSTEMACRRGVDISHQRARRAVSEDFHEFDYILAMDQDNYHALCAICPNGMEEKLELFLDYSPKLMTREVPDPYYGGSNGFEQVYDMIETAAVGLLERIQKKRMY